MTIGEVTCPTCQGLQHPSEHEMMKNCPTCHGRGWVAPGPEVFHDRRQK